MGIVDLGDVPWIISCILKKLSAAVLRNQGKDRSSLCSVVKADVSLIGLLKMIISVTAKEVKLFRVASNPPFSL